MQNVRFRRIWLQVYISLLCVAFLFTSAYAYFGRIWQRPPSFYAACGAQSTDDGQICMTKSPLFTSSGGSFASALPILPEDHAGFQSGPAQEVLPRTCMTEHEVMRC